MPTTRERIGVSHSCPWELRKRSIRSQQASDSCTARFASGDMKLPRSRTVSCRALTSTRPTPLMETVIFGNCSNTRQKSGSLSERSTPSRLLCRPLQLIV